jgi:hypothetical protein
LHSIKKKESMRREEWMIKAMKNGWKKEWMEERMNEREKKEERQERIDWMGNG